MTKENIILAALRLFLLRGYKYVSLWDVALEAGITKGGIYHYFSGKEALLRAAMYYLFDRFEAKYAEVFSETRTFQQILRALLIDREPELFAQQLLGVEYENYRLDLALFALEIMKNFPEIHKRVEQGQACIFALLEQRVQGAMRKGELRSDLDSRAVTLMIFAMLNGQNALDLQFNTPDMRGQVLSNLWKLIKAAG